MPRRLTSLHARTICHATEDPAKVELALRAVVGDSPVERSSTEGHFGNSIEVFESTVKDETHMLGLLRRMTEKDLRDVASTLDMRMDDACLVFMRLDKQRAYGGELKLSEGEDVIAVRIKVRAYPAKREIASEIVKGVLEEVVSNRVAEADRAG